MTDWRQDALCAQTDPEAFFPDKGGSNLGAKATCLRCAVRTECLEDALATHDLYFGIRGGMSTKERKREARRRGIEYDEDEGVA